MIGCFGKERRKVLKKEEKERKCKTRKRCGKRRGVGGEEERKNERPCPQYISVLDIAQLPFNDDDDEDDG